MQELCIHAEQQLQPEDMLQKIFDFQTNGHLPDPLFSVLRKIIYTRSEEHTSELQSRPHLVCRLLLEKKNNTYTNVTSINKISIFIFNTHQLLPIEYHYNTVGFLHTTSLLHAVQASYTYIDYTHTTTH